MATRIDLLMLITAATGIPSDTEYIYLLYLSVRFFLFYIIEIGSRSYAS